jgi:hypothetical protein
MYNFLCQVMKSLGNDPDQRNAAVVEPADTYV